MILFCLYTAKMAQFHCEKAKFLDIPEFGILPLFTYAIPFFGK